MNHHAYHNALKWEARLPVICSILCGAGLDEEGIYRKPGILSKATKLVKDCVERGKLDTIDLTDDIEWDTKTIASAVKGYFNKYLGEPLLTFDLHMHFVNAASELGAVAKGVRSSAFS